jgi:UMF1 family MFS transporter
VVHSIRCESPPPCITLADAHAQGFAAVTTAALLYAKTSIHMDPSQITLIGIISPLCGIGSNLLLPSLTMLNAVCCAAVLAPAYVLLSYIPALRDRGGFGSFSTSTEIFVFVAFFGSCRPSLLITD